MPRDDAPHLARWSARLALGFERRAARTVLASRSHDGPLVVQKPLYPEGESVCHAIVVHPPAGIAGGDELVIDVSAANGAAALLTTPGAGKWYRSTGARATQRVAIAADAASVEWLPQETILYDGAHADISIDVRLGGGATLVAWDIVCLGRAGSGERFASGRLRTRARIVRDGRLAWIERGAIAPGGAVAASPAGLDGRTVFGTMVVAAPAIEDEWLAAARACAPREGDAAATRLSGVLVARYRGDSSEAAREHFGAIWRRLREPVLKRAPCEPRIWRT
jgi:urease accessory protein